MNKNLLHKKIKEKLNVRELSEEFCCSQNNIRYWISKYNLKTIYNLRNESPVKICPRCKKEKLNSNFYTRRNGTGKSTYCKICTGNQTKERLRKFKLLCLEYKGGSCEYCSYNHCPVAMDFHHKDPAEKKFSMSSRNLYSFNKKVREELDKCLLLCANCHREEHARLDGWLKK